MTLLQLTYLLALDTHRHFRLAAEACHVTQPSLSMQLQKLEEELGLMLFDRNVRPIVPTNVGEQVIEQARAVLAEVERLRQITQEATGEMAGELRVGILSTISPYLLPLVIGPFARRYPKVSLIFEELKEEEIVDYLQRDLLDAGLVAVHAATRGIIEEELFEEPLVGYVSPDHRLFAKETIEVTDLHLDDLWLMSEGHSFRVQTLQLLNGHDPETAGAKAVQFESGNLETLQRLVDRGFGMTLLPWLAVQGEGSHDPESVRPFTRPMPTRSIRLLHSELLVKRHQVRALSEAVRKAVAPVLPDRFMVREP